MIQHISLTRNLLIITTTVSSETYVTSVSSVSTEPIGNAAIPQDQAWQRVLQDKNQI